MLGETADDGVDGLLQHRLGLEIIIRIIRIDLDVGAVAVIGRRRRWRHRRPAGGTAVAIGNHIGAALTFNLGAEMKAPPPCLHSRAHWLSLTHTHTHTLHSAVPVQFRCNCASTHTGRIECPVPTDISGRLAHGYSLQAPPTTYKLRPPPPIVAFHLSCLFIHLFIYLFIYLCWLLCIISRAPTWPPASHSNVIIIKIINIKNIEIENVKIEKNWKIGKIENR